MIFRIFSGLLLSLLLTLSACSGSGEQHKARDADPIQLNPLSDEVVDALCSLTGRSTERDLIALFGQPEDRKETAQVVLLRWSGPTWNVDAMVDGGQLQLAGAMALQPRNPSKSLNTGLSTWKAGQTRLDEMESHLGPGVRVGVQWNRGIPVAASVRNSPNFDPAITRDRCSDRYAWPNLNTGGFASLRFYDGVLQGAL